MRHNWSTTPGNSAHPPATVPSYMAAIVTSGVARNGAQLTGDTAEVVVIKPTPATYRILGKQAPVRSSQCSARHKRV